MNTSRPRVLNTMTRPCDNIKRTRERTELNQTDFWGRFEVPQATGSRYESGRPMPISLQKLIEIAYGTRGDRIIQSLRDHG